MPSRSRSRTAKPRGRPTRTPSPRITTAGRQLHMEGNSIVISNYPDFPVSPIWDELFEKFGDPYSPLTQLDSLRAAKAITNPADPVWDEVHALFGNSHEGLPPAELSPEPEYEVSPGAFMEVTEHKADEEASEEAKPTAKPRQMVEMEQVENGEELPVLTMDLDATAVMEGYDDGGADRGLPGAVEADRDGPDDEPADPVQEPEPDTTELRGQSGDGGSGATPPASHG